MKVSKFRKLIKEQSEKMQVKGVGARFTKEGIIVEAAIGNEMRKVNSFFNLIRNFLVNEGLKIDRMNISKDNKTQFSKFVINEATYVEGEDQEEDEVVSTAVNDDDIPDDTESYVDSIVDSMSDEEYGDYVLGTSTLDGGSDLLPDDEENIEIVLADDIDSLETDIVDEEEANETKVVDINAHNGEGPLSERKHKRFERDKKVLKEGKKTNKKIIKEDYQRKFRVEY